MESCGKGRGRHSLPLLRAGKPCVGKGGSVWVFMGLDFEMFCCIVGEAARAIWYAHLSHGQQACSHDACSCGEPQSSLLEPCRSPCC